MYDCDSDKIYKIYSYLCVCILFLFFIEQSQRFWTNFSFFFFKEFSSNLKGKNLTDKKIITTFCIEILLLFPAWRILKHWKHFVMYSCTCVHNMYNWNTISIIQLKTQQLLNHTLDYNHLTSNWIWTSFCGQIKAILLKIKINRINKQDNNQISRRADYLALLFSPR